MFNTYRQTRIDVIVFITGYIMPLVIRIVPNSAFYHSAKCK